MEIAEDGIGFPSSHELYLVRVNVATNQGHRASSPLSPSGSDRYFSKYVCTRAVAALGAAAPAMVNTP